MNQPSLFHFTPSLTPAPLLEGMFVQREPLLRRLVALVRDSALTDAKSHSLLIGPRGIGKTHLVSLLYHRLRALPELTERLHVAWLREEEWGVSSFLDLLLRVLRALASEHPDAALNERIEALYRLSPEEAAEAAARLLRDYAAKRVVLLLIENLDLIFEGLGTEGQHRLRSFLQECPRFPIVATAQGLFSGVSLRTSPFYGFFSPTHLAPLTQDEAVELLARIAALRGDQDLSAFVRSATGRARVRAVRHLAGGNHRIYVILSQFLTRESLDELVGAFMKTLDDLTPYYQSRMQALPPLQRKLVEHLCERRHALPVKEIAQRCFVSPQSASSQLRHLRMLGYVQATEVGRESYHELREPLMRLCIEVKKNRGGPLPLFVDLLRLWYSRPELEQRLAGMTLPSPPASAPLERVYVTEALRLQDGDGEDPVTVACKRELRVHLANEDLEKARQVAEELVAHTDSAFSWAMLGRILVVLKRPAEALPALEKSTQRDAQDAIAWDYFGRTLGDLGRWEESLQALDKALQRDPKRSASHYNRARALASLGRSPEELEQLERLVALNPESADAWIYHAEALARQGRCDEALASVARASEISPDNAKVLFVKGRLLGQLGRHQEALEALDEGLKQDQNNAAAWHNRARALLRLKRPGDALVAVDRALALDPQYLLGLQLKREAYFYMSQFEEALGVSDKLLSLDPSEPKNWSNHGVLLTLRGKTTEALAATDQALTLAPGNVTASLNRANLLAGLARYEEAKEVYAQLIERAPENALMNEARLGMAAVNAPLGRWEETMAQLTIVLGSLSAPRGSPPDSAFTAASQKRGHLQVMDSDALLGVNTGQILSALLQDVAAMSRWRARINSLTQLYARFSQHRALGLGLLTTIAQAVTPQINEVAAREWVKLWQEIAGAHPELQTPLRLLSAAVRHRETQDPRVFMELPQEERTLLGELISLPGGTLANDAS